MKGCSILYGPEATLAYTIAEASAIARLGRTSLYKAIRNGELRAIKLGGRTLILPADLQNWLESSPRIIPGCNKSAKAVQHVLHGQGPIKHGVHWQIGDQRFGRDPLRIPAANQTCSFQ